VPAASSTTDAVAVDAKIDAVVAETARLRGQVAATGDPEQVKALQKRLALEEAVLAAAIKLKQARLQAEIDVSSAVQQLLQAELAVDPDLAERLQRQLHDAQMRASPIDAGCKCTPGDQLCSCL
jgi:hypothetical protein